MTTKIYSKLDPSKLLHMIVRDIEEGRVNLCPPEQFLQCASLRLPKGTTFKAHRHIPKAGVFIFPDESWCVLKGAAKIMMYDTNGSFLEDEIINEGEMSFSFSGAGHNYIVLTDDFYCAEYKVGPYLGQEADKIFLDV